MYYNIIKITLPMMLTIFFVGCGGDDDKKVLSEEINYPEFISNNGKATNLLGYYGDEVYFGDKKIVGTWTTRDIDENGSVSQANAWDDTFRFYGDGTGDYKDNLLSSGGPGSFTYGIDNSAILIISYGGLNSLEIYSISGYENNCLKIFQTDIFTVTYPNPEFDAGYNQSFYLCKAE